MYRKTWKSFTGDVCFLTGSNLLMFSYMYFFFFQQRPISTDFSLPFYNSSSEISERLSLNTDFSKASEQNTWQFWGCTLVSRRQQRLPDPLIYCWPKIPARPALLRCVDDVEVVLGGDKSPETVSRSTSCRPQSRTERWKCMSSFPLLAVQSYGPPSAAVVATGLQWPTILSCAHEISTNMISTISIVSYVRNTLGEIPGYRGDRADTDKTTTEMLSRVFLPDVQMTAVSEFTGDPDAVLRSPKITWCLMEST